MRCLIFVMFFVFRVKSAENDYLFNYPDRGEWSKLMAVVNKMSSESNDDNHEITEDEDPMDCRLGYVSEFTFDCPALPSSKVPSSVHELTPADISVIGALGDSLTAAYGMESCTMQNLAIEYRGRAWSVGGDEDIETILTLSNILKTYNPNLKGYSVGIGDGPDYDGANFNVAVSGSKAEDMPGQARELIHRVKNDSEVDFQNDWKMATMFIGTNDLCQHCFNENKYATEQYVDYIRQALDILHEGLPRTFVNVVGILLIPELEYYSTPRCDIIHSLFCYCAVFKQGDETRELWTMTRGYQRRTKELVESGRYDTKDDFTVVYQPFLEETGMPFMENGEADGSYFAPDCFHTSSRGHAAGAKALWNNILQPVGQKNTSWDPTGTIHCPSEDFPYFYTNLNSVTSGSLRPNAS